MNSKAARLALAFLVAVRLALSLAFAWVVPPWEAYDEDGHFAYARYVAVYGHLPQPGDPNAEAIWSRFQPPLYYVVVAPVLWLFNLGTIPLDIQLNPFFINGNAGLNYAIVPQHPTPAEQTLHLAVRAGRMLSALIGAVSVMVVFATARLIWSAHDRRTWIATALYAVWPQAAFHGGVLTNDVLVSALATPLLYLVVDCWRHGLSTPRVIGLSGVLLLAIITKLNGLGLVVLAAGGLMLGIRHPQQLGGLRRGTLAIFLSALGGLLILGSLQFVTEHVFNLQTVQNFWLHLPTAAEWLTLNRVEYGLKTFFAVFGWGNVEVWPGWYLLAGLMLALAGLGGLHRLKKSPPSIFWWLVLAQCATSVAVSAALMIAQKDEGLFVGRYWLPALPCVVLLLAAGLQVWPARWVSSLAVWVTAGATWYGLVLSIPQAYAVPQPATSQQLERLDGTTAHQMGESIRLLGLLPSSWPDAGAPWAFTLCWQATETVTTDYLFLFTLRGVDNQGYGRLLTYPGNGNYPTRQWLPNLPFCDTYVIPVWDNLPMPARATLQVELRDPISNQPIPVYRDGFPPSEYAEVPVRTAPWATPLPAPAHPVRYTFDNQVALTGYTLTPTASLARTGIELNLHWQALADIDRDYVVFVHMRQGPNQLLFSADQPPRDNQFPTYWWQAGETVPDTTRSLNIPWLHDATRVNVYVGMYDAISLARLPVVDAMGTLLPNNEILLAPDVLLQPLPATRFWLPFVVGPTTNPPPLPAYP